MSVRVRETAPPPKTPRGKGRLVVLVVLVVVVCILAAIYAFTGGGGDKESTGGTPSSGATATAQKKTVLPRGEATAAFNLSTRKVGSVARGFPQTEAGAVEAATAYVGGVAKLASSTDAENGQFMRDAAPNAPASGIAQSVATGRERAGLTEIGEYPDLPLGERYYDDLLPQYGAYKVEESSSTAVTVTVWGPQLYGPGSPERIDDLQILWSQSTLEMAWQNGDWRVRNGAGDDSTPAPKPRNINRVDVPFKERKALLGNDWTLYRDATEDWPTDLLGDEPGETP